jgi:hypothetical protein
LTSNPKSKIPNPKSRRSLLVALTLDGAVEALQSGKRNKKYRLAAGS